MFKLETYLGFQMESKPGPDSYNKIIKKMPKRRSVVKSFDFFFFETHPLGSGIQAGADSYKIEKNIAFCFFKKK